MPPTPPNRLWIWHAVAGLGCIAWAIVFGWPMLAFGALLIAIAVRSYLHNRPTRLKKREGSANLG